MSFQHKAEYSYSDEDLSYQNTDLSDSSVYTLSDTSSKKSSKFTPEDDETLSYYVSIYGLKQWKLIAQQLPGKTPIQCMQRYNKIAKNSSIKGSWTKEEDHKLQNWVLTHGATKWAQAAKIISGRTGKQIRERWFNHLNPDVKRGSWSQEEDEQIFELYQKFGTSWSKIAKYMPGRPENSIKNRFYSTLRKLVSDIRKTKTDCGIKLETVIESSADAEAFYMNHLYKVILPSVYLSNSQACASADAQPIKVGSSSIMIVPSKTVSYKTEQKEEEFINYTFEAKESLLASKFDKICDFDEMEFFSGNQIAKDTNKKIKSITQPVENQFEVNFDDFVDKVLSNEENQEINVNSNNIVDIPQNNEFSFVFSPLVKEKVFDFTLNDNFRVFSDDSTSSGESQFNNNYFFEFSENWENNEDAFKLRFDPVF